MRGRVGMRRSVWENLRGRKGRNGMWERRKIEAVGGRKWWRRNCMVK